MMEDYDVVVIGAGFFGLAFARTYTEVNPSANLIVVDSEETLGGSWAISRLYPGLKTNNLLGSFEFPDFPMTEAEFDVRDKQHIPGAAVHKYLNAYVDRYNIRQRIKSGVRVTRVEKCKDGGWLLTATIASNEEDGGSGEGKHLGSKDQVPVTFFTEKLIIGAGLTSAPNMPTFRGSEAFNAPIFHAKDLLKNASTIDTLDRVVVLGGGKSAWDCVYAYASKGVHVDWIIRKSGKGPAWMFPSWLTPFKLRFDHLPFVRFLQWFSPCIWGDADGFGRIRRFFQKTKLGRWLVNRAFTFLEQDVASLNRYDDHPETKKLKPWTSPFWWGTGIGVLNYPTNFFDLVKDGKVKIHIEDISHLSHKTVHLTSGGTLSTGALLCATGWSPYSTLIFKPSTLSSEIGMPTSTPNLTSTITNVDKEILSEFPYLQGQPTIYPHSLSTASVKDTQHYLKQPWTLYRFMVPPFHIESRDLGFVGMFMGLHKPMSASIQALWLTAFLAGDIDPISTKTGEEIQYETMLHARFGIWRSPAGFGNHYPDFVFDTQPYQDLLMRELGLNPWRKKSFWREYFTPYHPADYRGIVGEWVAARGKARAGS